VQSSDANRILGFYSGRSADDAGRMWEEIVAWPDEQLEDIHDFIQWLFPLPERSGANPFAPVLDRGTIEKFRDSPELRDRLRISWKRMLRFYGLIFVEGESGTVQRAANFQMRARNWITPHNHNHLRITRILRSLRLLGLEAEAKALYACLHDIYEEEVQRGESRIAPKSWQFWAAAAFGDL
jgi:Opioid growth factor receptor (OGFr) conserved region